MYCKINCSHISISRCRILFEVVSFYCSSGKQLLLFLFSALPAKSEEEVISPVSIDTKQLPPSTAASSQNNTSKTTTKEDKENSKKSKTTDDTENDDDIQYIEQSLPKKTTDINNFDESVDNIANEQHAKNYKQQNGISGKVSGSKLNSSKENSSKKGKNYNKPDLSSSAFANNKDEAAYIQK